MVGGASPTGYTGAVIGFVMVCGHLEHRLECWSLKGLLLMIDLL